MGFASRVLAPGRVLVHSGRCVPTIPGRGPPMGFAHRVLEGALGQPFTGAAGSGGSRVWLQQRGLGGVGWNWERRGAAAN